MARQIRFRLSLAIVVSGFFGLSTSAASNAVGDASTARQIAPEKSEPRTVYRQMVYRELTVTVPEQVKGLPQALQRIDTKALRFVHKKIRLDAHDKGTMKLTVPTELVGQPGLLVQPRISAAWEARFHVDKPACLYVYINWDRTDDPNEERQHWSLYYRDTADDMAIYYRDFEEREELDAGPIAKCLFEREER